ncbi:LAFE_0B12420g1_1 [Lachancea fermentati]|uniref:LAFE_0B12420g1_1 n=1 Tax=Lachancea fermentati TaxID=4955 RepID=A0A1G4M8T4_LACFM|nr:LAFE_0B12420g1_1 [Lachancea fermentati]
MAKKSRSKRSRKIAQNALEIATRELDESSDNELSYKKDWHQNGTVINAQKNSDQEGSDFEDEEIDSDEALGSDDDYDVMSSKFSQTLRDKRKNAEYDEDEMDGYISLDENDLLPLSQVWDMDDAQNGSETENPTELQLNDDLSESELSQDSESDDESESAEEEDPFDEISEDEEDLNLQTITDNLCKKTEKANYRKLDNGVYGEENEYSLPSFKAGQKKLNLNDLMSVVEDKAAVEKASLIKNKPSSLPVPLPQRIQQRHDRKAAYEISKEEVNKWKDTIQQNRQAEHLTFPLNSSAQHNESTMLVNSTEHPVMELEKRVTKVLKESNLVSLEKESTFEEIATAKIDPDEMRKRTRELRLMRELMFREERKAKRIKKIKSKAYHRIKKKELTKNQELIEDFEESEDEQDIARARERMSLKHKTTSKWAKDMIKHGMTKDKETREEMEEMLKQGERLRSKVMGNSSEDDSDDRISDLENDDKGNFPETDISRNNVGKSGVMNMSFMKKAEARQAESNRKTIEDLKAFENGNKNIFDDDIEHGKTGANINLNLGRRVYTPSAMQSSNEMEVLEHGNGSETEEEPTRSAVNSTQNVSERSKDKRGSSNLRSKNSGSIDATSQNEPNPWLPTEDEGKSRKSNKIKIVDENSSKLTKSANKIEKKRAKQTRQSDERSHDEEPLLDVENADKLQLNNHNNGTLSDEGIVFKQQDLIAEAFAGDDVVDKFQQEKKRVAIDEDDKIEDVTLPGWGDWAGAGAAPTKKRKFSKIKGTVRKDKRRDRNLKNVIINEKVNKKNLKYQSSAVPFPFESKEQYERSLRMPLGQEWTSRTSHQGLIKPRILTKPSTVIDPLKAPFK